METSDQPLPKEDPWALVKRRISRPCRQRTFYVVLILGILILGYLGVWIEVKNILFFTPTAEHPHPSLDPLRLAYATAILAVGVPCLMQFALSMNKMAVVTAFVLAFLVVCSAYFLSIASESIGLTHFLGVCGLLVATLSWWLANGEDDLFQDRVNPDAASGGNPDRELSGGNSGIKL